MRPLRDAIDRFVDYVEVEAGLRPATSDYIIFAENTGNLSLITSRLP